MCEIRANFVQEPCPRPDNSPPGPSGCMTYYWITGRHDTPYHLGVITAVVTDGHFNCTAAYPYGSRGVPDAQGNPPESGPPAVCTPVD